MPSPPANHLDPEHTESARKVVVANLKSDVEFAHGLGFHVTLEKNQELRSAYKEITGCQATLELRRQCRKAYKKHIGSVSEPLDASSEERVMMFGSLVVRLIV